MNELLSERTTHVDTDDEITHFRTMKKFLWFPMVIGNKWRWFWWYEWREEYIDGKGFVPIWWVEK